MPHRGILFARAIYEMLKNAGMQMQNFKSPIEYDLCFSVERMISWGFRTTDFRVKIKS
jgi:hypothetical protein